MQPDIHDLLCEALRRFECFAVRDGDSQWCPHDLQKAWTGLGSHTQYKSAIDSGYMQSAYPEVKRANNWYRLTAKGAEVILHWHRQGFGCGDDFTLLKTPPPRPT